MKPRPSEEITSRTLWDILLCVGVVLGLSTLFYSIVEDQAPEMPEIRIELPSL